MLSILLKIESSLLIVCLGTDEDENDLTVWRGQLPAWPFSCASKIADTDRDARLCGVHVHEVGCSTDGSQPQAQYHQILPQLLVAFFFIDFARLHKHGYLVGWTLQDFSCSSWIKPVFQADVEIDWSKNTPLRGWFESDDLFFANLVPFKPGKFECGSNSLFGVKVCKAGSFSTGADNEIDKSRCPELSRLTAFNFFGFWRLLLVLSSYQDSRKGSW